MINRVTKCILLLFIFVAQQIYADNIGLVIMATGKYIKFVKPLIDSAEKHFCKDHNITYFVFTDGKTKKLNKMKNVVCVYQKKMGWPYDTMMRFATYYKNRDVFKDQDYLFACDADMLFVDAFGDEVLGKRVATIHPGFYNKPRSQYTYDTNPKSKAYIPPYEGENYFAGGFYGGDREEFINIAKVCSENIQNDLNKGIIAVWHDESHWNRYCIDNKPTVKLSPSYCYPESWNLPFHPRLLALDKDHDKVRKSFRKK